VIDLWLKRRWFSDKATEGELILDEIIECWTSEDRSRVAQQSTHVRVQACYGRCEPAHDQRSWWGRTLAMVQRYAHLAPGHLQAAVERLVSLQDGAVELARN
jgi:hypothetical protein